MRPETRKMQARPESEPLGPARPEPEGPKPDPTRARKKEACIHPYFKVQSSLITSLIIFSEKCSTKTSSVELWISTHILNIVFGCNVVGKK